MLNWKTTGVTRERSAEHESYTCSLEYERYIRNAEYERYIRNAEYKRYTCSTGPGTTRVARSRSAMGVAPRAGTGPGTGLQEQLS
jgi:hypothetical protein